MGARVQPVTLSAGQDPPSAGIRAATGWAIDRNLTTTSVKRWHVEVSLATLDTLAPLNYDDRIDTRFHVDVYAEEWGFFFSHAGQASWIRVTDIPFVHGRDDFQLLGNAATLHNIGALLRGLEQTHGLQFRRQHALIRTNLAGAEPSIRTWVESL